MNLVALRLATPAQLPPYVASKTLMPLPGFSCFAATLPTDAQRIVKATTLSAPALLHTLRTRVLGIAARKQTRRPLTAKCRLGQLERLREADRRVRGRHGRPAGAALVAAMVSQISGTRSRVPGGARAAASKRSTT